MRYTIAVGDIHGYSAKLMRLLARIDAWLGDAARRDARFVFVGDYVDRGPDPKGVIECVRAMQRDGAVCLRGNHEHIVTACNNSWDDQQRFLMSGGPQTRQSFGSASAFEEAQEWMRSLPTSFEDDLRYFVHAGIDPSKPLDQQDDITKMSIRDPFLRYKGPFPKYVVHGHTPTTKFGAHLLTVDIRENRCNVDTGAGNDGPLSAAIFSSEQAKAIHTISVA